MLLCEFIFLPVVFFSRVLLIRLLYASTQAVASSNIKMKCLLLLLLTVSAAAS